MLAEAVVFFLWYDASCVVNLSISRSLEFRFLCLIISCSVDFLDSFDSFDSVDYFNTFGFSDSPEYFDSFKLLDLDYFESFGYVKFFLLSD